MAARFYLLKKVIAAVQLRRQIGEDRLNKLSQQAADEYKSYIKDIEEIVTLAGFNLCQDCQGFGRISLDPFAAARRTLGMRNWDGCPKCGGTDDKEGLGFVPAC